MIEVAIMVEGQDGLNWPRWQRMARAVEELGFVGLYRSDHFTNPHPPDLDSLELWISLAWLASHTQRIEFGPLVAPVSFRHPVIMARQALAIDDLSNGRLTLGLGAGWQEREHSNFGFELLDTPERFARFEEGLHVISQLLHSDQPMEFTGKYYSLHDAVLLPRPQRPGGPPLLIGGNGVRRTLPLAARFADEWNAVFLTPQKFAELNTQLDTLLHEQGRRPDSVRRSIMVGTVFGRDESAVRAKLAQLKQDDTSGRIVGTAEQFVEQVAAYAEAGVQRIMLQWLDLDDITGLELLARKVLA